VFDQAISAEGQAQSWLLSLTCPFPTRVWIKVGIRGMVRVVLGLAETPKWTIIRHTKEIGKCQLVWSTKFADSVNRNSRAVCIHNNLSLCKQ
jgi:hypothetical protein